MKARLSSGSGFANHIILAESEAMHVRWPVRAVAADRLAPFAAVRQLVNLVCGFKAKIEQIVKRLVVVLIVMRVGGCQLAL